MLSIKNYSEIESIANQLYRQYYSAGGRGIDVIDYGSAGADVILKVWRPKRDIIVHCDSIQIANNLYSAILSQTYPISL